MPLPAPFTSIWMICKGLLVKGELKAKTQRCGSLENSDLGLWYEIGICRIQKSAPDVIMTDHHLNVGNSKGRKWCK